MGVIADARGAEMGVIADARGRKWGGTWTPPERVTDLTCDNIMRIAASAEPRRVRDLLEIS